MKKSKKLLTGGQAAVQSLKKEGVKHVFGLIGSATMEMFDALYHEKKIKFIEFQMIGNVHSRFETRKCMKSENSD